MEKRREKNDCTAGWVSVKDVCLCSREIYFRRSKGSNVIELGCCVLEVSQTKKGDLPSLYPYVPIRQPGFESEEAVRDFLPNVGCMIAMIRISRDDFEL